METIKEKLQRLSLEFKEKINSGEIKTYGKNKHGFDIVLKSGTKLQLKTDNSITAIAFEDCCITSRIKYTSAWTDRNFKKGDYETLHTYSLLNIFNII